MRRPQTGEYGSFYQGYIDRTRGVDFLQNLEDSGTVLLDVLNNFPEEKRIYSYAKDKWSVIQMLKHIIDTDLVFNYRALSLARNGGGTLEGFDHDLWAKNSLQTEQNWEELLQQFRNQRNFSIGLFHSFPEKVLDVKGEINGFDTVLRSIPFIMAGHSFHHVEILKTRYL